MSQETVSVSDNPAPSQLSCCAAHRATQGTGQGAGQGASLKAQPKNDATGLEAFAGMDEVFDLIAAGLYNLASMLVGEGEDSIQLVEQVVATADLSAFDGAEQARKNSRLTLSRAALDLLARRDPRSLAAPQNLEHVNTCIQDEDLDTGDVSSEELARLMSGPERGRVRRWLVGLPVEFRAIFALRAVAGFSSPEVASLLAAHGGPDAAGWAPEDVREIYRQALCSLSSQVIHAAHAS
jgi:DNA-directed RNA polymerase specialized sigma24 family protein